MSNGILERTAAARDACEAALEAYEAALKEKEAK